jgi:integrase
MRQGNGPREREREADMAVKVREKVKGSGDWWLFIDHKGKRKAKKVGSREDAEAQKEKLEEILKDGPLTIRTRGDTKTFRQYATDWLKTHVKNNLTPATYRDYSYMLEQFILPELGSVPIAEVRREEIKALCFRILGMKFHKGYDKKGKKIYRQYSKSTAHHVVRIISAILGAAKEERIIQTNEAENPGKFITLPRPGESARILTLDEADALLTSTLTHFPDDYPLLFTLLRSGLRNGEVRGLQWNDVDEIEQVLLVRRAWSKKNLSTPKSGKPRKVHMGDRLKSVLQFHRAKVEERAAKKGKEVNPDDWIFTAPKKWGEPLYETAINQVLNRCLKKAGLPHIRVHDLRHTVASWRIARGTPVAYVKDLLGHSTIKLTVDTYGHEVQSADRAYVNGLDAPREKKIRNQVFTQEFVDA